MLALLAPAYVKRKQKKKIAQAIAEFKLRRESLEGRFFTRACVVGKPRGLRWKTCDWKDPVRFAQDRNSGLLTAFVSVEINFEAIEGEGMEEVAAVGDLRDASAVFHYEHGQWGTGGKALFNMNPETAIEKLTNQFASVDP